MEQVPLTPGVRIGMLRGFRYRLRNNPAMHLHGYYFSEDNDRLHAPNGAVVASFHRVMGRRHPFVKLNFPTAEQPSLDDELPLELAVVPIIRQHLLLTTTPWERFNARLASFASNGGWQWVGIAVTLALGVAGLWVSLST